MITNPSPSLLTVGVLVRVGKVGEYLFDLSGQAHTGGGVGVVVTSGKTRHGGSPAATVADRVTTHGFLTEKLTIPLEVPGNWDAVMRWISEQLGNEPPLLTSKAAVYRTKIVFDLEDDGKRTAIWPAKNPTHRHLAECIRLMCVPGTYEIPTKIYGGHSLLRTETVMVTVAKESVTWRVV